MAYTYIKGFLSFNLYCSVVPNDLKGPLMTVFMNLIHFSWGLYLYILIQENVIIKFIIILEKGDALFPNELLA